MKKTVSIYILLFISLFISSCSEDKSLISDPFVVAFEGLSTNIVNIENQKNIPLVYSETTFETGYVAIQINASNANYGTDFTTIPEAINNVISLPINANESSNTIVFNKHNQFLDETTEIEFSITSIDYVNSNIQGNTNFILNASASLGGRIEPEVGGPNEGNQVFIDLSSDTSTFVQRDSWDLGFYGGDEFRVAINGTIYMAATELDFTDIDAVSQINVSALQSQVAVGTFNPANEAYIDAPNGNILETAITEVSDVDEENKVYLVNLGYEIGTATPTTGSVAISGNTRGWKKIRVLKTGNDYVLQYADIDATTHQEVTISKDASYNFSFFSFNTNKIVDVEPEKERWDISFTVFTNVITGAGSYGYSDFVIHNRKGGAETYMLETSVSSYADFNLSLVDENLFLEDQTVIGANWRDVFSGTSNNDRFFILKDPNGNIYKIKFLALTDSNGERGYPEFEYELLQ